MSKSVLHDGDEDSSLITKNKKPNRTTAAETRSPVHVVYGGAHLFKSDTPEKLGRIALQSLKTYALNFVEFADAIWLRGAETLPRLPKAIAALETELTKDARKIRAENFPAWFAWTVYQRTINKLQTEPVEDYRIDFEDGYGFRMDEEEDAHAISASSELAKSFLNNKITRFSGFRIKSFAPETLERATRTLKLFLNNFLKKTGGALPENFAVTLPKVSNKNEVKKLCDFLKRIEKKAHLQPGAIKIEIMIETPLAIIDEKGRSALTSLVEAAKGRCTSAHFGAYDYTAALGISATHQHLRHDACKFARQMILAALAPMGIRLSDSVTTEMPIAVHKGEELPQAQLNENKRAVHIAWRTHFNNITKSMIDGFYQSWDLHPNQLVPRFAAVYAFFLEAKDVQSARLRGFIEKATQASLTGNTFDDAASAQGLMNFFRRAVDCGALTESEVIESTGLSPEDLRSVSFMELMQRRRQSNG